MLLHPCRVTCPATSATTKADPPGAQQPSTSWMAGGAQLPRGMGGVSELLNLRQHRQQRQQRRQLATHAQSHANTRAHNLH